MSEPPSPRPSTPMPGGRVPGFDDLSDLSCHRTVEHGRMRIVHEMVEAVEGRDAFLEKRDPDWSALPWYS